MASQEDASLEIDKIENGLLYDAIYYTQSNWKEARSEHPPTASKRVYW